MPAKKSAKKSAKKPVKKSAKKSAKKTPKKAAGLSAAVPDYRQAYVNLRTLLDSLEMGSLHYFLNGKTNEERDYRAGRLFEVLMPVLTQIQEWDDRYMSNSECPPGYINCNGCCVPYPCPGDVPPEGL